MPVRRQTAAHLTQLFVGEQWWHGTTGECQTMPTAEHDKAFEAADLLWERLIAHIDWARVIIEASSRHLSLVLGNCHPGRPSGIPTSDDAEVCGWCVQEALLDDEERRGAWVDKTGQAVTAPRRRRPDSDQDPAAVLAAAVQYRQGQVRA